MNTDLKAPPLAWPVLADDPDWSLHEVWTVRRTLANGSSLLIEFVWSTDVGFSASVEVAGEPFSLGPVFDKAAALVAAEVANYLVALWAEVSS